MKTIALALVSTLAVACYTASAPGLQVQTAASPSAPFAEYRTFSFGFTENPPTAYHASARSLDVEHRVRELTCAALREKGYVKDDAAPNLVVRLGAGTQQDTEADVEVDPTWSSKEDTVDIGKIEVDIFDASTKTAVWRGSAVAQIDLTKAIDNSQLRRVVQSTLAEFPRRSWTGGAAEASRVADNGSP
jgi:hypothetical protein